MYQHAQLIFAFLVETGFHHVGQACLELLTSSDLPALASQSAGTTSLRHCAQPALPSSKESKKLTKGRRQERMKVFLAEQVVGEPRD